MNLLSGLKVNELMDVLVEEGTVQEMILVMPSGENAYWGSWYVNSEVTGGWEDFIAGELVAFVDENYRTVPAAAGRGIGGASMGGYGAMILAMRHPDTFSAVYASAAVLDFEEYFLNLSRDGILHALGKDSFGPKAWDNDFWNRTKEMISTAAVFAPNPDSPPLYGDFPLAMEDDEAVFDGDVWERFLEHDPLTMISRHTADLLQLQGIMFDCGTADELFPQSQSFSDGLTEAGVPHEFVVHDGDHFNRIRSQFETAALPFFSDLLLSEDELTAVVRESWGEIKATGASSWSRH